MFKKILIIIIILLAALSIFYFYLSKRPAPEKINYGVSFNTLYAKELHLDWEEVYRAILNDLGVRRFRLAAHWNMVEPENDQWNFVELDKQIDLAEEKDAKIILAIGRRLPRWPECHVPSWAIDESWEFQQKEILEYIEVVVNRYKDREGVIYWQVENEPYLEVFAKEHCGDLDEEFLKKEIELVKSLDDARPVLVTDSGNLGTWISPWKRGDAFGTSVYVYLWNKDIGPFKSYLPPSFYRFKTSLMEILGGKKESMLIELSLEPWLLQPVVDTPVSVQLERMNIQKFKEIISFAKETNFENQYLWGAEWWYYMNQKNHPEFWDEAKEIFN
ncbi:MAG: beta-galactosidase [Candidatus Paceibacterota bacterium]